MRVAVATLVLVVAYAAAMSAGLPELGFGTRRLLLVRRGGGAAEAAARRMILTQSDEGDDVRLVLSSPDAEDLLTAEGITTALSPSIVGGIAVQTAAMLSETPAGDDFTTMERALAMRDYALRGTSAGSASVIVGHESVLGQIICAAKGGPPPELPAASVSVLDFDDGSWPAASATSWCEGPAGTRVHLVGYCPAGEAP